MNFSENLPAGNPLSDKNKQIVRVVFLGTPAFAIPSLKALIAGPAFDSEDNSLITFEVAGVLTQPDKPAGRGQKLTPPPVKILAEELGIPVFQPISLRKDPERIAWLRELHPDFLVTAAFGQILSQEVLDIPKYGTINVHASLLPDLRGPNPVQWAILKGLHETGVTTMLTDIGVDTGDMLLTESVEIEPTETAAELTGRLSVLGGSLLVKTLSMRVQGKLHSRSQLHHLATHAPKLEKEAAHIDWTLKAQALDLQIRGQQPSPGAYTFLARERIKLLRSHFLPAEQSEYSMNSHEPGTILGMIMEGTQEGLQVQTGEGCLLLLDVQLAGKRAMSAKEWALGALQEALKSADKPRFHR